MVTSVKTSELSNQTKAELTKLLNELKQELSSLRVQKVSNGSQNKVTQIGTVRKSIAKVFTAISLNQKKSLVALYKGKKYKPLDLRPKKTRAIRKRLTNYESGKVTLKEMKKRMNLKRKSFYITAPQH